MRTEDGSIIYECLSGDPEAFGILVDKYKASIYAYVYSKIRSFQDAEDVTQEVFLQAYCNLRGLRHWESFAFWLHRIARNLCNKWIRARSRRPDSAFVEDQDPETLGKASLDAYREHQTYSSLHESLQEALDSLSPTYREVLTLHYFGGMTIKDMARGIGVSPAAMGKRLSRARAQLKEEMVAMIGTAFEGKRLRTSFTFRIVEAIKSIKIHPMPRLAGLPWALSMAAGIIIAILSIGSHLNLPDLMDIPMDLTLPGETTAAEVGEIPVDVLKVSRIPIISGKGDDSYGGRIMLPDQQNPALMAPSGEENGWPEEPAASLGKGTAQDVAYSPDGKLLAVAGGTGIWLYDAADLSEVGLLKGHTSPVSSVDFSPDGKLLASGGTWQDNTVRLWDVETQTEVAVLRGHTNEVNAVSFSPDGNLLASASWDKTVRLWDVNEQKRIAILGGHTDNVACVSFSPDGGLVASAGRDKTIRLWDVGLQKQAAVLEGHTDWVYSVSFSPDGRLLASTSGDVRIWDITRREQIDVLSVQWICSVSFSPDGSLLALGAGVNDGRIWLWDLETNKEAAMLGGHTGPVNSLSFSRDGRLLASLGEWRENTVRLWDIETHEEVAVLRGYTDSMHSLSFSPDGDLLASGSWSGPVRLWDMEKQEEIALLSHADGVQSVSFSPDGAMLAVGNRDNAIHIWDVEKEEESIVLRGHTGWVESVSFSPDGKLLASAARDKTVRLWDMEKQEEAGILEGHTEMVDSVSFSPDGKLLASGSEDKTVRVWDVQARTAVAVLRGHSGGVYSVSFSPDGKLLASSGGWDRTIRIWDVESKAVLDVLSGHTDWVLSVAFSPDGKWLASGSESGDRTVRIWDVDGRKQVAVLRGHSDAVWSVSFSPDGEWLASASKDGTVLLWEMKLDIPGEPVEPIEKQLVTWGEVKRTELFQNFPNPSNPETWIPFSLAESKHVTIMIYNSTGQLVRTLDLGQKPSGAYLSKEKAAYWDGRNEDGETVASDVYFYAMEAGGHTGLKKMVLAR